MWASVRSRGGSVARRSNGIMLVSSVLWAQNGYACMIKLIFPWPSCPHTKARVTLAASMDIARG